MAVSSLICSKKFWVCLLTTIASARAGFWVDWVCPHYDRTVHVLDEYTHNIVRTVLAYDFIQKLFSTSWKKSVDHWADLAIKKSRILLDYAFLLRKAGHSEVGADAVRSTQSAAITAIVQPPLPAEEALPVLPAVPPLALPVLPTRQARSEPVIAQKVVLEGIQDPTRAPGHFVRLRTDAANPSNLCHPANTVVSQDDLSIAQRIRQAWMAGHSYRIAAIIEIASTTTGLHQSRVQIFDFAELRHAVNKQNRSRVMKVLYNPNSYIWIRDLRLLNVLRYDVHRGMFVRDDVAKNKLLRNQLFGYVDFYFSSTQQAVTQGAATQQVATQEVATQRGVARQQSVSLVPEIAHVPAITSTGDQACIGFNFDLRLTDEHAEYWSVPCFSLADSIDDARQNGRPFYLAVVWEGTGTTAHPFCFDSQFLENSLAEQSNIDHEIFIFSIPGGRNPITRQNIDPNKLFVYRYNQLTRTFEPDLDGWLQLIQKLPLELFKT